MRKVGLHFRLKTTVSDLLEKALRVGSPLFQCFLIRQGDNSYAEISDEEIAKCQELVKKFDAVYLHSSYWVNFAGCRSNGWRAFRKELAMAKQLGFTHIVMHPGSATGCATKEEGIARLAKNLNRVFEEETEIKIVLENVAHSRKTVGGNLYDFKALKEQLNDPKRLLFCLDTAHAHSYGYDVVNPVMQDQFLQDVDDIIGRESLALLHVNDVADACGSYLDRHALVGKGTIGQQALKRFINNAVCKNIPIILEPPLLETEDEEKELLALVRSW